MPKKIKATRTINPLHFEDLEPHRFEDLVRRLLYGFREWSSIEPTGRSGSDDGFDVRAWEKGALVTNIGEEGEEGAREFEGRLWQVQSKREKTITPAKIRDIVRTGVDTQRPPYGYILAAATNISKSAYDAFRNELKSRGVVECHFWGKDYLEDQLSLPQNDEILFTFFGLSLSPQRRSRTAELKFNVNNKNKILRVIFGNEKLIPEQAVPRGKSFLLRDVKAEHYPYADEYPDFETYRRWEEHEVVGVNPRGLIFKVREWYAYFDKDKSEWDFSRRIDLTLRKHNIDKANQLRLEEEGKHVERFWRHLPQRFQAKVKVYGVLFFEDMLSIDDKGDTEYTDPHIFIDFGTHGPFHHTFPNLVKGREPMGDFAKLKRIKYFPEKFPEPTKGMVREIKDLGLGPENEKSLHYFGGQRTVHSFNLKSTVSESDLIQIPKDDGNPRSSEKWAEVTHIYDTTVGALLQAYGSHYESSLESDAGRKLAASDRVRVYEMHEVWVFDGRVVYTGDEHWSS